MGLRGVRGKVSPEYSSWLSMRDRCSRLRAKSYEHYGGRGIRVCERWGRFETFLSDMGPRPPGTSLDRIDVNGNYEPSNCRWADKKTQQRNMRWSTRIPFRGRICTIPEISEITQIPKKTIEVWKHRGLDIEKKASLYPERKLRCVR